MKYDARACHFNMDTGCVELLLRDIDCSHNLSSILFRWVG